MSITLRRHSLPPTSVTSPRGEAFPGRESVRYAVTDQGPVGLWDKVLGIVKGKSGGSPEENGYIPVAKTEQTPPATYATYHPDAHGYNEFRGPSSRYATPHRPHPHLNSWLRV